MASTISPARQALFTALQTAFAADSTVIVAFGEPAAYEDQQMVCLTGLTAGTEDFALIGPNAARDERYGITLKIKVHDPTAATGETVDARSYVLYDTIRNAVKANKTLSGSVLWAITLVPRSDGANQATDATGWVVFTDITVACYGRAT